MPPKQEVYSSLYGAWRLIRLDAAGMGYFNVTADGFWRSFFAAVIIAPFYMALSIIEFRAHLPEGDHTALVALDMVNYVLGWMAIPIVMIFVTRFLDRRRHYARFIIAMNWIAVPQWVLVMATFALFRVVPGEAAGFLYIAMIGVLLFYDYFVARTALDVGVGQAIAIALLAFLVMLLIDVAMSGLA